MNFSCFIGVEIFDRSHILLEENLLLISYLHYLERRCHFCHLLVPLRATCSLYEDYYICKKRRYCMQFCKDVLINIMTRVLILAFITTLNFTLKITLISKNAI